MVMKKAKDCDTAEEVYACLKEPDEDRCLIRTPEDSEGIEDKILGYTNRLGALLLKKRSRSH
jgi:hypothetical protein